MSPLSAGSKEDLEPGHSTADHQDAVDGVAEFHVTLAELKTFMKERGHDAGKALREKFGDVQGLVKALQSSAVEGLMGLPQDLENRQKVFGVNYIPPKPPKTFLRLIWEALEDTILRILTVAAIISVIIGVTIPGEDKSTAWIEGFAIIVAVIIVALVTAINDYQKEQQFRNLQNKIETEHKINVIRHGEPIELVTKDLVVGDVCQIGYGDVIPADGVIITNNDLRIDESSLTGESDMVKKSDADPFLLSGTHIMEGSGKMIVTAVGINSQAGMIFDLLNVVDKDKKEKKEEKKHKPPAEDGFEDVDLSDAGGDSSDEEDNGGKKEKSVLQAKLTKLAVTIGWLGVGAAVITTVVILIRYSVETYAVEKETWKNTHLMDLLRAFIVGLTIMVVAIPEGLPLAVTIALAYSVKKMLVDKNLVRHLDACETMGNATAICSDKTGTLTTNRMTVVQSYLMGIHYKETPPRGSITPDFVGLLCRGIALNSNRASRIEVS